MAYSPFRNIYTYPYLAGQRTPWLTGWDYRTLHNTSRRHSTTARVLHGTALLAAISAASSRTVRATVLLPAPLAEHVPSGFLHGTGLNRQRWWRLILWQKPSTSSTSTLATALSYFSRRNKRRRPSSGTSTVATARQQQREHRPGAEKHNIGSVLLPVERWPMIRPDEPNLGCGNMLLYVYMGASALSGLT